MKNMTRNEIEQIATNIIQTGDIIANHGTSIENAISIINTGFNFTRTSLAIQPSKNIESLCGYGWKENGPDDSSNVIISIPKSFIMDLLSINDDEYQKWLQNVIDNELQRDVINSVATLKKEEGQELNINSTRFFIRPTISAHIPENFIAGAFIWCNGKTYLNLKEGESALDNLSFIPNENFYLNMSPESKSEFIEKMRNKMGLEIENKKMK